jgi:hypothetical protein
VPEIIFSNQKIQLHGLNFLLNVNSNYSASLKVYLRYCYINLRNFSLNKKNSYTVNEVAMTIFSRFFGYGSVTEEEVQSLLNKEEPLTEAERRKVFEQTRLYKYRPSRETTASLTRPRNICLRILDRITPSFLRSAEVEDEEQEMMEVARGTRFTINDEGELIDNGAIEIAMPRRDNFPRRQNRFTVFLTEGMKAENYNQAGDFKEIIETAEAKERYWQGAIKHVFDTHRSLQGWEYTILVLACIVATGAVSTSKAFGDRFIEAVEGIPPNSNLNPTAAEELVEVIVALSNICTQFSLTTKNFIQVLCRLSRTQNAKAHEYINQLSITEKLLLASVITTGFASDRMTFTTWQDKYHARALVDWIFGALSWTSSVAVNMNFTYDRLLTFHSSRFDLAIARLLNLNQFYVNTLANDDEDPDVFIEFLSTGTWYRQLNHVNGFYSMSAQAQAESIIRQLMLLTPIATEEQKKRLTKTSLYSSLSVNIVICTLLGLTASTMNLAAGLGVPHFLNKTYPEVGFFNYIENLDQQTLLTTESLFLGLFVFGLTSYFVNTIINTRSCQDLSTSVSISLPDFLNYGFTNYSRSEKAILSSMTLLALGYAIAKGGQTLIFSLVETPPAPIVIAGVTFIVCLGLGIMAMKAIAADMRNRKDKWLLMEALRSPSLVDFYYHSPVGVKHQQSVRRLLESNYNLAIHAFYSYINQTKTEIKGHQLLSPELYKELEEKFGQHASTTPTRASTALRVYASPRSGRSTPSTEGDSPRRGSYSPFFSFSTPPILTLEETASVSNRGYSGRFLNRPHSPSLKIIPLARQQSNPTTSLGSVIDGAELNGTHSPATLRRSV